MARRGESRGGENWEQTILEKLQEVDIVLICLSKRSINKRGIFQKEIRWALDVATQQPYGATFIIPVKLEDCVIPKHLDHLQVINLYEEEGYKNLIAILKERADEAQRIEPKDPRPDIPISYSGQDQPNTSSGHVSALKYGMIATVFVSLIAIGKLLQVNRRVAYYGTIFVILSIACSYIFLKVQVRFARHIIIGLSWLLLLLFSASGTMLCTSTFFQWPVNLLRDIPFQMYIMAGDKGGSFDDKIYITVDSIDNDLRVFGTIRNDGQLNSKLEGESAGFKTTIRNEKYNYLIELKEVSEEWVQVIIMRLKN